MSYMTLPSLKSSSNHRRYPMRIDTAAEKETFLADTAATNQDFLHHVIKGIRASYNHGCASQVKQQVIYEVMVIRGYLGGTNE